MFIAGDGELRYGDIIAVIDAAKGAGVEKVGIVTEEMRRGGQPKQRQLIGQVRRRTRRATPAGRPFRRVRRVRRAPAPDLGLRACITWGVRAAAEAPAVGTGEPCSRSLDGLCPAARRPACRGRRAWPLSVSSVALHAEQQVLVGQGIGVVGVERERLVGRLKPFLDVVLLLGRLRR